MTPADALDQVSAIVTGKRNDTHGDYADCLAVAARLWNVYLTGKKDALVTPADVCRMMSLLKIARTVSGGPNLDHDLDGCGYFAIAAALESESYTAPPLKG